MRRDRARRRTRRPAARWVKRAHYSRPRSRCETRHVPPGQPGREPLGDRHRAVLAAGAADGERHVPLAFPFEPGERNVEHREVGGDERGRRGLAEHVVAHRRVEAAQRPQLGHPVRVGQEPAVGDQVRVHRQPVLVAERDDVQPQPGQRVAAEVAVHPGAQLVHVQRGRVEDDVGVAADLAQQLPLRGDAVENRARALHGVRPAHVLEALDEGRVGGLEEQHVRGDAARAKRGDRGLQVGGERSRPDIDDRRDAGQRGPVGQVEHGGQQRGRQVLHHEPAEVLQRLGRGGPPGTGHAGDDDDVGHARRHALTSVLCH